MSTKQRRERRRKLWAHNPRCRFCGTETVLPEDIPGSGEGEPEGRAPEMATLECLDSRYRNHRGWTGSLEESIERTTLACQACNQKHERRETEAMPDEVLRRRSQQHGTKGGPIDEVDGEDDAE